MKLILYGNGSSGNHGCEAIVRGTSALLAGEDYSYLIRSVDQKEDVKYGLNNIGELSPAKSNRSKDLRFLKAYLKLKLTGNYTEMDGLDYAAGIHDAARLATLALSLGGDNYCYTGIGLYSWLNREYHKNGIKTILWGCSVEPAVVSRHDLQKDFSIYDGIMARESITFDALRQFTDRLICAPDPAFYMPAEPCDLDRRFNETGVIGINASPMILSNETTAGLAYENYLRLITNILNETDRTVALIPHVVWPSNDDRAVLKRLYEDLGQNDRLLLINDHTAPQLKYIISHCEFLVAARTHASIAAYSSSVPALVIGYSVKAHGIARDLFGNESEYVLPVQNLTGADDLTKAFWRLYEKQDLIITHYQNTLINYLSRGRQAIEMIKSLH